VFIAKHISPTILTVLEHLIQTFKHDRFYAEHQKLKAAGSKRILYGGLQNLTNVEIFKVLRWEIRPLSKAMMKLVLRRSVFPASWYEYFQDESKIRAEPKQYYHVLIHYFDNFEKLIDLVEDGKEFFPTFIIGRKEMSGEATGVVDHFLRGCPNIAFAYLVMKEGIADHMRTEKLTWDEFKELYIAAIQAYCEEKVIADDANLRFVKEAEIYLPPYEVLCKQKALARSLARKNSTSVPEVNTPSKKLPDPDPYQNDYSDDNEEYMTGPEAEQPPSGSDDDISHDAEATTAALPAETDSAPINSQMQERGHKSSGRRPHFPGGKQTGHGGLAKSFGK